MRRILLSLPVLILIICFSEQALNFTLIFGDETITDPVAVEEAEQLVAELKDMAKDLGNVSLDRRNEIVERFIQIGKPAVTVLIEALNDDTRYGFVQRTAAESLGKIGDKDFISTLMGLLIKGNVYQRRGAVEALGKLKAIKALPNIIKALEDEDWHVQMLAAISLGDIGDKGAVGPLINLLNNKETNMNNRAYSAESLGRFPCFAVINSLILNLESANIAKQYFLAESCDRALYTITGKSFGYRREPPLTPAERKAAVRAWKKWWESEGKSQYPE